MIVVVGQPLFLGTDDGGLPAGLPARISLAAASQGRSVQLVGKAGEDPEGDAVVLGLASGGVGHVAFLRDAGMSTPLAPELVDDFQVPDDSDSTGEDVGRSRGEELGGPVLDSADVELALRYLTDYSVVVLAEAADEELGRVVASAAGWSGAMLIVVVSPGGVIPNGLPPDAIVFEAPDADPDGVFATMVGSFAAALDDGSDPATAFRSTVAAEGWTAATNTI